MPATIPWAVIIQWYLQTCHVSKQCMLATCWKMCAGAADSSTPYQHKMGEALTKKEKIRILSWQKKKNKNG